MRKLRRVVRSESRFRSKGKACAVLRCRGTAGHRIPQSIIKRPSVSFGGPAGRDCAFAHRAEPRRADRDRQYRTTGSACSRRRNCSAHAHDVSFGGRRYDSARSKFSSRRAASSGSTASARLFHKRPSGSVVQEHRLGHQAISEIARVAIRVAVGPIYSDSAIRAGKVVSAYSAPSRGTA